MASAAHIPFRTDPSIGLGQLGGVLAVTLILLVIVLGLLLFAHRRGWLSRWSADGLGAARMPKKAGWKTDSQRISRQIVVYTLRKNRRTLVIVESGTKIALTTWSNDENPDSGHVDAQH